MAIDETCCIDALIIHHDNPIQLRRTVNEIAQFTGARITIIDNSKYSASVYTAHDIASEAEAIHLVVGDGVGWGQSINHWLDVCSNPYPVLLVAAHDAKIERFDKKFALRLLRDENVFCISAENDNFTVCHYSPSRFFYFKKKNEVAELSAYAVDVGHSTAALFRTSAVNSLRFDEEFFLYGCESEIFLRAAARGWKTMQTPRFRVTNPATDSSSDLVNTAFLLNSLYCAHKHHGKSGMLRRTLRAAIAAGKSGDMTRISKLLWAWKNVSKGFRSYRDDRRVGS